ncbi:ubiquitin carboxyl-terminal hydrolase 25 [Tanacetum coccineum]
MKNPRIGILWLKGRVNKDGEFPDDEIRLVGDKLVWKRKVMQEEWEVELHTRGCLCVDINPIVSSADEEAERNTCLFDGIFGWKIDKAIAFGEVLVLSSFKASQDAVGCWYCCNDSYVSVSNLQEVLSEKVYILFFSRTKQRPVLPNKCYATNGTKALFPKLAKGKVTQDLDNASGELTEGIELQEYIHI